MTQTMDLAARMMLAALCAVLTVHAAPAQEGAPAGGGGAPQTSDGPAAALTSRDIEPFTPQRAPAGLQRRANLKTLIANALGRTAGAPPGAVRTAPLPVRSAALQRNAIGVTMTGVHLPGHGMTSVTLPAGNRLANMGTPNPSGALRGGGINGATMKHMSAGPGLIGGPAKNLSGINGTLMPSKH